MRVLIACEFSGEVRRAFRAKGHDAWSCDLLPAEDGSPNHHEGDVRLLIGNVPVWPVLPVSMWIGNIMPDLMIAFPPCTFLCNSGVRWLYEKPGRWEEMRQGAEFFKRLLNAPIPKIAIENPIQHKHAAQIIGQQWTQTIQPWQFGHGEIKRTCFWLKNLPPLKPTEIVEGRVARVHRATPSPDRWKERSRTYSGIAKAMAEQWGCE